MQGALAVVTMHPVVGSGPHVAKTLPARQTVPPIPPMAGQSVGGGKHVQLAPPEPTVHCFPPPHGVVAEMPRQPLPSIAHWTSVFASLQTEPAIPPHITGGVGHVQTPATQGLPAGQLDVPVMFKQPSPSSPQVAIDVDD